MPKHSIHIDQLNVHFHSAPASGALHIQRPSASSIGATTRFESTADGSVVLDDSTGLMWASDELDRVDYAGAEKAVAELRLGGHDDWQLPTLEQLESIRDLTRHAPCIDTDFFKSNKSWVWTRTPCAWSSDYAWVVYFANGYVNDLRRYGAAFVRPVRAVSAGQ